MKGNERVKRGSYSSADASIGSALTASVEQSSGFRIPLPRWPAEPNLRASAAGFEEPGLKPTRAGLTGRNRVSGRHDQAVSGRRHNSDRPYTPASSPARQKRKVPSKALD